MDQCLRPAYLIKGLSSTLKAFVHGFQYDTELGIHTLSFVWTDTKEGSIKYTTILIKEVAFVLDVSRSRCISILILESVQVENIWIKAATDISRLAQQVIQLGGGAGLTRKSAGGANNGDGNGRRSVPVRTHDD
ncbi:hypothetical protein H634G_06392 [Metarhizium anisopliae BRIP 53293]|uniref:Uncharacterized protein n=1 Tax=Metarhizium anisopliae BRIP 53293 TaxID=1291518 RepID=A0A0D9NW24_METAN|nr:hypothetical protein H634G_06392 [Metarhizium anisopliae BRIP 53293]KJK89317.1 hypothetical protein H633G_06816 [Metarhizium anisopliae BRIP 53284]